MDEQKLTTLKHLAATTLQFLLQLKLIFCTFLKKEFQLKKNKLISRCFFQEHKKIIKITSKNKTFNLFKTPLDYYAIFYYRVVNYKCNRWETLLQQ